jgi:hypothetical protein
MGDNTEEVGIHEVVVQRAWLSLLKLREGALRAPPCSHDRERRLFQGISVALAGFRLLAPHRYRERNKRKTSQEGDGDPSWRAARADALRSIQTPPCCIACESEPSCFALPCTHQAMCLTCWRDWFPQTCPFCKESVDELVLVVGR